MKRDFSAAEPDRVWVGDITYVPTAEGLLYLAVLIDLFSRRVVGWATSSRIDQQLTLSALDLALTTRRPMPGLVHHTDRGSQYAARAYRRRLARHDVTSSMSSKGDCWDNAVAESFFGALKSELIHERRFVTRAQARRDILNYLFWYNGRRLHSTLDYLSPVDYENAALSLREAA